jgi:transcriptional regulator with XRE-family HTH domain
MAWKEMTIDELAKSLGVNASEVREKQKLIQLIVKIRKAEKISQAALAKKVGVTQGRIAQVESGVGTSKITFDVLLGILSVLGYDFKILAKRAA